VGRCNADSAC